MYTCMYIYIAFAQLQKTIHTYIHTYMCTYKHTLLIVCKKCIQRHIHIHTCIQTYMHASSDLPCTIERMDMYSCAGVLYVYVNTQICHAYVHTKIFHVYVHAQMCYVYVHTQICHVSHRHGFMCSCALCVCQYTNASSIC